MRTFEIYGEDYEMLEDEDGEWIHKDSVIDLSRELLDCETVEDIKKVLEEEDLL